MHAVERIKQATLVAGGGRIHNLGSIEISCAESSYECESGSIREATLKSAVIWRGHVGTWTPGSYLLTVTLTNAGVCRAKSKDLRPGNAKISRFYEELNGPCETTIPFDVV